MDNLSHTLAGLLVAELSLCVLRSRGRVLSPNFARAAHLVSALANNLPDSDSLYARSMAERPLGYLLHHRGHTHTVLGALVLAALALAAFAVLGRGFRRKLAPGEWSWLVGLGLFGSVLHIAMDYTNNYGVHLFWPLFDGWMYGDFVFIVEPLFFALCIPPLIFVFHSRLARVFWGVVLAAVVALCWLLLWVPVIVGLVVTILAAVMFWVGKSQPPLRRSSIVVASSLAVALGFWLLRGRAESSARASLPADARLEDVVLTPMPGNPLCFSVWRVSVAHGDYVAERGVVASLPALLPVRRCTTENDRAQPTAPVSREDESDADAVHWTGVYRAPVRELAALDSENCNVRAFLHYARVPFWMRKAEDTVIGDLRYDRAPELEFAEMVVPSAAHCPRFVPGWTPPRRALLAAPVR